MSGVKYKHLKSFSPCTGILGSAIANEETLRDFVPQWLNGNHSLKSIPATCMLTVLC